MSRSAAALAGGDVKPTAMDRGLYFRGLLQLVRLDRDVSKAERDMVMHLGRCFGFDRDFCREALDEVLRNPHIKGVAPVFSDPAIADSFMRDGMRLARQDGSLHPRELRWLEAVALRNDLDWSDYASASSSAVSQTGSLDQALAAERWVWT